MLDIIFLIDATFGWLFRTSASLRNRSSFMFGGTPPEPPYSKFHSIWPISWYSAAHLTFQIPWFTVFDDHFGISPQIFLYEYRISLFSVLNYGYWNIFVSDFSQLAWNIQESDVIWRYLLCLTEVYTPDSLYSIPLNPFHDTHNLVYCAISLYCHFTKWQTDLEHSKMVSKSVSFYIKCFSPHI